MQEWKEDYDRWDNTVAAGYGMNVAEHQAEKSYVFDLDENGDVRNCTVTSGGGKIVGPTEENSGSLRRSRRQSGSGGSNIYRF